MADIFISAQEAAANGTHDRCARETPLPQEGPPRLGLNVETRRPAPRFSLRPELWCEAPPPTGQAHCGPDPRIARLLHRAASQGVRGRQTPLARSAPQRPRHPSLDLPAYLAGYDRVIFIDAVALDAPPEPSAPTPRRDHLRPHRHPRQPHEPTINDTLIVLDFAGTAPREVELVGVVPRRSRVGWRCRRGWRGR
jgi:hypothetical protein